jgi:large subunit ribosomal protein L10
MPKTEKVEKVADLRERIERSQALLLTDFQGITVADATELRRSLRTSGARFAVVKNTLMRRAAIDLGADELEGMLTGPTAVTFVDEGDVAAVAKSLSDAARRFPSLELKGAYMEGRVLDAGQARALADLEPRPVLLAKIAGLAKGEMSRAASMFQALQGRFLSLLEAYKEKLPAGEEAAPAEAAAEEAPAAETAPEAEAAPEAAEAAPEPEEAADEAPEAEAAAGEAEEPEAAAEEAPAAEAEAEASEPEAEAEAEPEAAATTETETETDEGEAAADAEPSTEE